MVENAVLAIEDVRFYDHIGIDPYRIAGVLVKNFSTGKREGASTITQQLAKNLFLTREQTYTRKISEWMMALEIERFYTKRQILEMYMNYHFLGAGSYGFEAGARTYFGKTLKDLELEEAALLAAILKSPEYSPTRNMTKAKSRRNIVLDQMAKYNFISSSEATRAKNTEIKLADSAYYQALPKSTAWDYPVEEVRKYLERKYTTRVAQGGLQVYTTINVEAQEIATSAIRQRLRSYDRGRKWRSEYRDILVDANEQPLKDAEAISRKLRSFKHADWYGDEYAEGEYIKGLVMSTNKTANVASVRFGKYKAMVKKGDMGRAPKGPAAELKPGYLAEFLIEKVDDENETLDVKLSQVPEVQAAITSIDAKTGEIVALVGGYDFHTSKFNNATQGLRQTGSCYKPFVYAAALENGMTPDMTVSGAPIRSGGWRPKNYNGSLSHPNVPMKTALAKSYNLAAVHLLRQVGVQTGAQMVRRLGITNPMAPSLPSALGASEASLVEMVSAYSTFPNKGVRMQPHLIKKVLDRDGKLLEQAGGTSYKVTSEYVALSMVDMMRGVTRGGGTAPGANAAGHPLAGKTGTVNKHTDVWFIGYTPRYVTGVWMGNPTAKVSLGRGMTGGGGALPYFNSFMSRFMRDKKRESFPKTPKIPKEIKALVERRKRENLEKLERAEAAGVRVSGKKRPRSATSGTENNNTAGGIETIDLKTLQDGGAKKNVPGQKQVKIAPAKTPAGNKNPGTKPKPPKNNTPKQPAGKKRKGKKGTG